MRSPSVNCTPWTTTTRRSRNPASTRYATGLTPGARHASVQTPSSSRSVRHSPSPEAPKLWAQLAAQHDGKDRWYLEALGIGADKQWDKFLDAWLAEVCDKWNTPAGHDIVWRSRSRKTPALLVKIINDQSTSQEERQRCFRSLDFISGPEKDAAMAALALSGLK